MKNQIWSVAQQSEGYATDIEIFTGPDAKQKAETYRALHGGALVRGEQMWNEPIGQIEDHEDQDAEPHVGASIVSGANVPEGPARPKQAIGDFIMSTKSKTPKTTKATVKPDAKRTKAVAAAQATDAAANAKAVKPNAKGTKITTVDAGGGIMVDVVETATPAKAAKATKAAGGAKEPKVKKTSGLDAAAQVLRDKGEPMSCKDIVETMLAKGMWKTGGKTPAATIYSAMLREIDNKPGEARFAKTGRGLFALAKTKA